MRIKVLAALLIAVSGLVRAAPENIAGKWDATVTVADNAIPFHLGFLGTGKDVKGWFFNGSEKEVSSSGRFENGTLVLNFDSYASVLNATLKHGVLDGQYTQRGKSLPVHAVRSSNETAFTEQGPEIQGTWILENVSSTKKDEKAWYLTIQQKGTDTSAAILRVDGDTGTLTGGYRDGKFILSHFSGARPSEIIITPQKDGTLAVELIGQHHSGILTAYPEEEARRQGLPSPTNANRHTGVKDPSQPFAFSFTDLNGKVISNTDEQFRGQVVLVNITGSWCPNCHDEAPFLAEIYNKYHKRGLEIVALSFEELRAELGALVAQ